jgi:hypothetical protein
MAAPRDQLRGAIAAERHRLSAKQFRFLFVGGPDAFARMGLVRLFPRLNAPTDYTDRKRLWNTLGISSRGAQMDGKKRSGGRRPKDVQDAAGEEPSAAHGFVRSGHG